MGINKKIRISNETNKQIKVVPIKNAYLHLLMRNNSTKNVSNVHGVNHKIYKFLNICQHFKKELNYVTKRK